MFVRELVLGVLRHKLRLDHTIGEFSRRGLDSVDTVALCILRLGLFQLMFMGSVPDWAAVDESVRLASEVRGKGAAGFVNAVLRRFTRDGEPPLPERPVERLSIETSHPEWLVSRWVAAYGEETAAAVCRAGVEKHPVFIRTFTGKISTGRLAEKLADEGFEAGEVPEMPGYLSIAKGTGLFETEAFREGLFVPQDPSAGMACRLLAPVPGETVLDLCAAPGGKTTHCAEMMGGGGEIVAVDIHENRLGLVRKAAERLGLASVTCVKGDAASLGEDFRERFDRVLLDVPCSGTGVLSKRPDLKWRIREKDIGRLAELQRKLMASASRFVKPGGVLVYSTCSLEPEENGEVVSWFLENHRDYELERVDTFREYETGFGYLILPCRMYGAGAFAARIRRRDDG